jgi:hypothetical protein
MLQNEIKSLQTSTNKLANDIEALIKNKCYEEVFTKKAELDIIKSAMSGYKDEHKKVFGSFKESIKKYEKANISEKIASKPLMTTVSVPKPKKSVKDVHIESVNVKIVKRPEQPNEESPSIVDAIISEYDTNISFIKKHCIDKGNQLSLKNIKMTDNPIYDTKFAALIKMISKKEYSKLKISGLECSTTQTNKVARCIKDNCYSYLIITNMKIESIPTWTELLKTTKIIFLSFKHCDLKSVS